MFKLTARKPSAMAAVLTPVVGALLAFAGPAEASMIPPVELRAGQASGAVGLASFAYDHALTDRLSVGVAGSATYLVFLVGYGAAARATYRFWESPEGMSLGLTLSGGHMSLWSIGPAQSGIFLQPALNVTLRTATGTVRATLGPMALFGRLSPTIGPVQSFDLQPLLPNIELAFPLSDRDELTLGGYGTVGWRRLF